MSVEKKTCKKFKKSHNIYTMQQNKKKKLNTPS